MQGQKQRDQEVVTEVVEAWTEWGEVNVMRNALILDVFEGRGEEFASGFYVRDEGKDCWFFDPLERWSYY